MKILMLGWELPPHNSGGLGVACYHLSKALASQGADIEFVIPYTAEHPNIDFMKINSVTELSPLERNGLGAYDSGVFSKSLEHENEAGDLKDMRGVQKKYIRYVEDFVKTHTPDVIHVHDWLTMEAGVIAKQITGAPLIVHVHATEFDRSGENGGNPLVHEIEHQGLMMADKIFAVSGITKSIIVQNYGIPADKIEIVYNAIDTNSFDPEYNYDHKTYKYIEHLKEQGYVVASTITRFTAQKGLVHLMRAAKLAIDENDKLIFLFAGDGEQKNELIQLAADFGISRKIFFTGFVRGKRWRDAYSVSDIFVMSSVSEPFGLTALEAAHHGCSLAISHQSGVGEVLKDAALRFDYWNTYDMALAINRLATNKEYLEYMKQRAHEVYNKTSWDDVSTKCIEIYNKLKTKRPMRRIYS